MSARRLLIAGLVALASCGDRGEHEEHADELPSLSFTHFAHQTELFLETPALVVGHDSPFGAHLTVLEGWKPVAAGRLEVVLSEGGPEERFTADGPTVPGIFRPVVRPTRAGKRRLLVTLQSESASDEHDLGEVEVYATEAAAKAGVRDVEASATVPFLLEQQWRVDFDVQPVAVATLRDSVPATGSIRAVPEREGIVAAPVPGRVVPWGDSLPRLGSVVKRGTLLAALVPSPTGSDAASLDLDLARAQIEAERAGMDLERAEALLAEGAVPERRVQDARTAAEQARASLRAARTRRGGLGGAARGPRGGRIALRAPVDGTLVEVEATSGAFVEAGREVFHVVDLSRLWLEVRVPEADIGRLRGATGASFEVDGLEESFEATPERGASVVTLGGRVDPESRTIPFVLEIDNSSGLLRVGMAARARVLTGTTAAGIAIPTSAVVRDGGLDVAWVLVGGEAFERRLLRLGIRDGDRVQVQEGLREGERIVTRGAWYVRLAASAGSAPAHGHAH